VDAANRRAMLEEELEFLKQAHEQVQLYRSPYHITQVHWRRLVKNIEEATKILDGGQKVATNDHRRF